MATSAKEDLEKLEKFFKEERDKLESALKAEEESKAAADAKAEDERIAKLRVGASEHARYVVEDIDAKLDKHIAAAADLLKERLQAMDEISHRYGAVCHIGHHARNPRVNSAALSAITSVALRERRTSTETYASQDARALNAVYASKPKKAKAA